MKFTAKDNCPAIYIRFKNDNYTVPTYVGETERCFGGRPFRKNARGSAWQGSCKYKSIYILKCPEDRLLTREAYFVLHNFPIFQRKQLNRYFKIAAHLLTTEKLMKVIDFMSKGFRSPGDLEYINEWKEKIKQTKTPEERKEKIYEQTNLL